MSVSIGAAGAGAVLATVNHVTNQALKYDDILSNSKSLVSATAGARVEPTVFLDPLVSSLPVIGSILQTNLSLFTGFWLQALQMQTATTITGASVAQVLAPLNPNRDANYKDFTRSLGIERAQVSYSVESYRHSLPGVKTPYNFAPAIAAEADVSASFDGTTDKINDIPNLAVGKIVDVTIGNGERSIKMPVSFRLMTAEMPFSVLEAILTDDSSAKSIGDRWQMVRSGRIKFVDDFLLCKDLYRARKKMLAQDKSGVYTDIKSRQLAHKRAGLATGSRSLAEASNIIVMDSRSVDMLAEKHGINLNDFGQRQRIFDSTGCMMMTVVNTDYERVTFYYDTLRASTSLGWGDLKVASKNQGPNIMDIFSAMNAGRAPSF